jgi:hypothetical protein
VVHSGNWLPLAGQSSITTGQNGAISFDPGGSKSAIVDMAPASSATLSMSGVSLTGGSNSWSILVHGSVSESGLISGYTLHFDRSGNQTRLVVQHIGDGTVHDTALATYALPGNLNISSITVTTVASTVSMTINGTTIINSLDLSMAATNAGSPYLTMDSGAFGLIGHPGTRLVVGASLVN